MLKISQAYVCVPGARVAFSLSVRSRKASTQKLVRCQSSVTLPSRPVTPPPSFRTLSRENRAASSTEKRVALTRITRPASSPYKSRCKIPKSIEIRSAQSESLSETDDHLGVSAKNSWIRMSKIELPYCPQEPVCVECSRATSGESHHTSSQVFLAPLSKPFLIPETAVCAGSLREHSSKSLASVWDTLTRVVSLRHRS